MVFPMTGQKVERELRIGLHRDSEDQMLGGLAEEPEMATDTVWRRLELMVLSMYNCFRGLRR